MQYSSVEFVIGFAILFLCGYIIYERIPPKELFQEKVLFFILLCFCLSLVLSTVFARYKVEAVKYDIRIMSNIALFYLFLQFLFREKLTQMSLIAVNIVGIAITIVGVMEFFRIGGIKEFLIQNQWGIGSRAGSVTSVFIHNNIFGNYLVLLIFVTLGQLKKLKGRAYAVLLWFCLGLFIFNLGLSLSRSSWAAFIGAVGFFVWFKRKDKKIFIKAAILASVFAVLLIAMPITKQRIVNMLAMTSKGDISRALSYRLDLWRSAIVICQNYPLLGIGLNNFKDTFPEYTTSHTRKWPLHVHAANNQYLNVLAEQGLLGFSIFIILAAYLVSLAIGNMRNGGNEFFAVAIIAYFIGAFFDYMFVEYTYMFMFWFVVILNLIEKRQLELRDLGISRLQN